MCLFYVDHQAIVNYYSVPNEKETKLTLFPDYLKKYLSPILYANTYQYSWFEQNELICQLFTYLLISYSLELHCNMSLLTEVIWKEFVDLYIKSTNSILEFVAHRFSTTYTCKLGQIKSSETEVTVEMAKTLCSLVDFCSLSSTERNSIKMISAFSLILYYDSVIELTVYIPTCVII